MADPTMAENPFIRYRRHLDSYGKAIAAGWTDQEFVATVERLDAAVAEVDGHGFEISPVVDIDVGERRYVIKDDTGSVSGSHKARHLFGVMLHLLVERRDRQTELAIASCGNAALAAAVIARACEWPLRVFIPTWADPPVVARLDRLGARIEVCERTPGHTGDPTYHRLVEVVRQGAIPFSCQATMTPTTLDGGRTIGWELADQLAGEEGVIRLFVQVGGGALASAAWMGLTEAAGGGITPILHGVQTEACAPLVRAWDRVGIDVAEREELVLPSDRRSRAAVLVDSGIAERAEEVMHAHPEEFMWPWEVVGGSHASGILDDVTYDWRSVVGPMLRSGGWPVVIDEKMVERAWHTGRQLTGIDVSATGTAGLAGAFECEAAAGDTFVVFFTGASRD